MKKNIKQQLKQVVKQNKNNKKININKLSNQIYVCY